MHNKRVLALTLLCVVYQCFGSVLADTIDSLQSDYRIPKNQYIVDLLTATQIPSGLLHAASGRAALIYREALVPVDRIARPHLGLSGFLFDPVTRASGYDPRIEKIVVFDVRTSDILATWAPPGTPSMDYVEFSPDGRRLSAVTFGEGAPRLTLFDIDTGHEQMLPVTVNPAFESPCEWMTNDKLLCRIVPDDKTSPPAHFPSPNIIEHPGGAAPTRTYVNLLDNAWEEALFEYYFSSTLARISIDGNVRRLAATGLLARVSLSPDRNLALIIRLQRPYSHLLKAQYFGRRVEIWDLEQDIQLAASSLPQQPNVSSTKSVSLPTFKWKSGAMATIGWTESIESGGKRWVELDPPYSGKPREVTRSRDGISTFGWTNQGTPLFSQNIGSSVRYFTVAMNGAPQLIWQGSVKDLYGKPGTAVRINGNRGPILEFERQIFLASDGLGPEGPQPYVDSLNLDTLKSERIGTAPDGVYERLVGIVDPSIPLSITVSESETEPPQIFSVERGKRRSLAILTNPFPQLTQVERRNVQFMRKDGVLLTGMLYLPRQRDSKKPLPTLIWIYPAEFSDKDIAEQVDARRYRFHQIKEASPIAAVLEGYALLLNPTVPIIGEGEAANDAYLPQLISSMEAAIDFLVDEGISDRNRMAVAGRSYGAFSTANLLVHTNLFKTGIAISGAYNRTLTPFGFQHEKRSFWEATNFYTRISPFYYVDKISESLLLMHGGSDDNPGTPTLQARRFFHALVGNGVNVRYVELPYERHHYRARENVLHTSAEMLDWLDRTIGHKVK